jgi:nicotinate dehydrogenase subunit A
MSISLTVNDQPATLEAGPDTPLLYVLRNDLKLKGTRFGCGSGECGACTVWIDGRPIRSCDTPLWAAEGKAVTTIEGLGGADANHPMQRAVLELQAGQCGYCLSGIIMTAAAFLRDTPHPTREAAAAALERNLCRCGVRRRVLDAVEKAAEAMR